MVTAGVFTSPEYYVCVLVSSVRVSACMCRQHECVINSNNSAIQQWIILLLWAAALTALTPESSRPHTTTSSQLPPTLPAAPSHPHSAPHPPHSKWLEGEMSNKWKKNITDEQTHLPYLILTKYNVTPIAIFWQTHCLHTITSTTFTALN